MTTEKEDQQPSLAEWGTISQQKSIDARKEGGSRAKQLEKSERTTRKGTSIKVYSGGGSLVGKKRTGVKSSGSGGNRSPASRNGKPKRGFPAASLQAAVQIALKIKELNGGNPWRPEDVAKALGMSYKTVKFFYLSAASRDYGLTEGTRDTSKISLTELGRRLVYPQDADEEIQAHQDAFFFVPLFKQVYQHYQGPTLPELKYLSSTLKTEFGLDEMYHEEFRKLFQENCQFLQRYGVIETRSEAPTEASRSTEGAKVVTWAAPKQGPGLRAFVALPFSEKSDKWPKGFFSEVLSTLIIPAGVEAGFKVETARKEGSDIIQATIVTELLAADLVIADLTEHNPNVLFELGMRIAFDKPVTLIRARGTPPIFDIDNMLRVMEYSPNLWKSTLEMDLPTMTNHIRATWEGRKTNKSYLSLLKEQ